MRNVLSYKNRCSHCRQTTASTQQDIAGPALCVGDTPLAGILDELDVLVKCALLDFERGRLPLCPTTLKLLGRNLQLDRVFHRVDGDDVPVTDEGDGSTDLRLRHDMPDAEPMGSTPRWNEIRAKGEGKEIGELVSATGRKQGGERTLPSAEASVREGGDVLAQTGAHDQTGRLEHLRHT